MFLFSSLWCPPLLIMSNSHTHRHTQKHGAFWSYRRPPLHSRLFCCWEMLLTSSMLLDPTLTMLYDSSSFACKKYERRSHLKTVFFLMCQCWMEWNENLFLSFVFFVWWTQPQEKERKRGTKREGERIGNSDDTTTTNSAMVQLGAKWCWFDIIIIYRYTSSRKRP